MRSILCILALMTIIACGDNKKNEIQLLGDEVIELHDEAMPLMDGLYQTRMKLQKVLADSTLTDSSAIVTAIGQIKLAEDAMMDWMHNFNPVFEGETDEITLQYLTDQKASITVVGEQMRNAKKQGELLLEK